MVSCSTVEPAMLEAHLCNVEGLIALLYEDRVSSQLVLAGKFSDGRNGGEKSTFLVRVCNLVM